MVQWKEIIYKETIFAAGVGLNCQILEWTKVTRQPDTSFFMKYWEMENPGAAGSNKDWARRI